VNRSAVNYARVPWMCCHVADSFAPHPPSAALPWQSLPAAGSGGDLLQLPPDPARRRLTGGRSRPGSTVTSYAGAMMSTAR